MASSFKRAARLPEPLRSHFPKSADEAQTWEPIQRYRALSSRVLAVAQTRIVCQWAAYIDAVPGLRHSDEYMEVLNNGAKLSEDIARKVFPEFDKVPYAA